MEPRSAGPGSEGFSGAVDIHHNQNSALNRKLLETRLLGRRTTPSLRLHTMLSAKHSLAKRSESAVRTGRPRSSYRLIDTLRPWKKRVSKCCGCYTCMIGPQRWEGVVHTGRDDYWCCEQKLAHSAARQLLGYHGRPLVDFPGPRRQRAAGRERAARRGEGMVRRSLIALPGPAPVARDTGRRTIKSIVKSMF